MPVAFALVAALGFGVVLVLLARCSDQQVAGTLLVQKGSQFAVMGLVVAAARKPLPLPTPLRTLPLLALVGWGDAAANGLYVLATRSGYLSVVAVFASLYPVATVLIARRVLHERLRRVQVLGVTVAVAGVVLMAAG